MKSNLRHRRGFSLVEILISLVIGLFLMGGIFRVYLANKEAYRLNDAIARLQENGRFAIDFLARDLRLAGYNGCGGRMRDVTSTLNPTSDPRFDFADYVQGYEATGGEWSPAINGQVIDTPRSGSDILLIRGAFSDPVKITGQPNNAGDCALGNAASHTADLKVNDASRLSAGDIVLATDCSHATIFQITNVNQNSNLVHNTGNAVAPGNRTKDLGACYAGQGQLMKMETRIFYVQDNDRGQPALYRIRGSNAPEELVEGVEQIQIRYGVDSDNDRSANKYSTADQVTANGEWPRVVSIRVEMLLHSVEDQITTAPQPYTFNGTTTTPSDRRLRRVFTTTVALRNLTP